MMTMAMGRRRGVGGSVRGRAEQLGNEGERGTGGAGAREEEG
jgi:hypothetical protein